MNSLFVAWRPPMPDPTGWRPIGRLEHDGDLFRFWYTQGARKPGFRPFVQMEALDQIYESVDLFPVFGNRLLSKSRPEYEAFMRWSGFDSQNPPDPIVVLGVTEGRRETDAIEVFPCPTPDAEGEYVNRFFLHGVRRLPVDVVDRVGRLIAGECLKVSLDPQNEFDPHAVAVRTNTDRMFIGYVPRYLAHDVRQLMQRSNTDCFELNVVRVNPDAPLRNRVLCQMRASWPRGFQPCSDSDFAPIPIAATVTCNR